MMKRIFAAGLVLFTVLSSFGGVHAEKDFSITVNGEAIDTENCTIENDTIMCPGSLFGGGDELEPIRMLAEKNGYSIYWNPESRTAALDSKKAVNKDFLGGRISMYIPNVDGTDKLKNKSRIDDCLLLTGEEKIYILADELLCCSVGDLKEDAKNLGVTAFEDVRTVNNISFVRTDFSDAMLENLKKCTEAKCHLNAKPNIEINNFDNYIVKLSDNTLISVSFAADSEKFSPQEIVSTIVDNNKALKSENGYIISDGQQIWYDDYTICEIVPEKQPSSEYKYRLKIEFSNAADKPDEKTVDLEWNINKETNYMTKKYYKNPDNPSSGSAICTGFFKNDEQLKAFSDLAYEYILNNTDKFNKYNDKWIS